MEFPCDQWFQRMVASAREDPETYARLGFAEFRLVFEVEAGDDARRFGLVLDGYDVEYAGELADVAMFGADAILSGPIDAWREMVDNIKANGRADVEHTLIRLCLAGSPLRLVAVDPMGRDKFFRYAETLQTLVDATSARLTQV
jgi:hypothetical protein